MAGVRVLGLKVARDYEHDQVVEQLLFVVVIFFFPKNFFSFAVFVQQTVSLSVSYKNIYEMLSCLD